MKIKWLGHASFLITADDGTRIITDPYDQGEHLKYGDINETADIVTISHDHFDHNNIGAVKGNPQEVRETTEARGIKITGIHAYHDNSQGAERGKNTIFCFQIDGMKVCHLGDLGHALSDKQAADIGKPDILIIPVGGFYTMEPDIASQVCNVLEPKVIIPMHFKNEKCELPITTIDDFLEGKQNITRTGKSEIEFKAGELPGSTEIIILQPAL